MPVTPESAAASLTRREALERVQREQRAASLRDRARAIVRHHLPAGARAWLIGSLAWGGFGEGSDVDVVVEQVPAQDAARLEVALVRALRIDADVLHLEELPEPFRERVRREGVPLHAA
jgi:predicted nucleotidyltransferase